MDVIAHHSKAVDRHREDPSQGEYPILNPFAAVFVGFAGGSVNAAQEHLLHAPDGAVEVAKLAGLNNLRSGGNHDLRACHRWIRPLVGFLLAVV